MPSYQIFTLASILKYNITNYLHLPSNNFEEDITLKVSNNGKEEIKPVDTMGNNNKNSKLVDID